MLRTLLLTAGALALLTVTAFAEESAGEPSPIAQPHAHGLLAEWIVGIILIATYIAIAFEAAHRTLAALLGGALLLMITYIGGYFSPALKIIDFDAAMMAVDWNVIFLLFAMMIVVGVLKETGVFQWFAYKAFAVAGGGTFRMAALLMVLTAVVSANLDNVTTMLLIAPVSIEIARVIGISPLALLIPETLASNIGGTATLIGDPPNIMIGSHAGLTYMDFVINLAPVCVIILIVHLFQMRWVYRVDYAKQASPDQVASTIEKLRVEYRITDRILLIYGSIVLAAVILMFLLHGMFDMPVAVPALAGAAVLIFIRDWLEQRKFAPGEEDHGPIEKAHGIVHALEKEVEWPTLIFFAFLFVIVGAAEEVGLIARVANLVRDYAGGSLTKAILLTLWISAIASAFIDNIPFTATMLPLLSSLSVDFGEKGAILWWALALGACLGGNGTIIGASANVVTSGLAEKAGAPISFKAFMRVGFPAMLVEVFIAMLWLLYVDPWLMGR